MSRADLNISEIIERLEDMTYRELAETYGVTRGVIAGIVRDYRAGKLNTGCELDLGPEMHVEGDFLILNDVHVPFHDRVFLEDARKTAVDTGITRVILAGDIVDFGVVSSFDHRIAPPTLAKEIESLRGFFDWLTEWATEIVYLPGNHEDRLLKRLSLPFADMVQMVTKRDIITTHYDRVFVTSGGQKWLVCHQSNASRDKLRVANGLAHKYLCNVAVTHQHKNAISRDVYGNFTIASIGGCHDPRQAAYVQLKTSTSAVPEQGFGLLIDGKLRLYDRRRTFTG